MTTMVNLIGEQPIPNLLPVRFSRPEQTLLVCTGRTEPVARRLQGLIPGRSNLIITSAYDFGAVFGQLKNACDQETDLLFNLTGGTKIMSLAAYALALERGSDFVYLQSEGSQSLLFRYAAAGRTPLSRSPIPTLITCDDYLRAHLPGYRTEGFHCDTPGNLSAGGRFEEAVYQTLAKEPDFELLAGVRPEGVGDQIEIDLVIRRENQVGIAEVKLGDVKGDSIKKGIDQLATAGRQNYLGTYTQKFLVTARPVNNKKIRTLAENSKVHLIELRYDETRSRLADPDAKMLIQRIKEKLATSR